jgi:hypothetical protein
LTAELAELLARAKAADHADVACRSRRNWRREERLTKLGRWPSTAPSWRRAGPCHHSLEHQADACAQRRLNTFGTRLDRGLVSGNPPPATVAMIVSKPNRSIRIRIAGTWKSLKHRAAFELRKRSSSPGRRCCTGCRPFGRYGAGNIP